MDELFTVFDLLKYTIPALIVFFTAYFSIKSFIKNDMQRRRMELAIANHKTVTSIRLQAYERLVLLLERIAPESLMFRVQKQKMTCRQLQTVLLSNIRSEFEHNLSQQVYISPEAWAYVKNARESMVKLINTATAEVDPEGPSMLLIKEIFEDFSGNDAEPTKEAIEFLKLEIRELFSS